MGESFISKKDRIIASAIEIISDSGLSALTTKNLAAKENISEELLYKYFGSIEEVLIEVVESYCQFDMRIRQTVKSKQGSNLDKLKRYLEAYATYYDSYFAISTLMLQYEELLHNADVRDKIAWVIMERMSFIEDIFRDAIAAGEIECDLTPLELANNVTGIMMSHILSRRIEYHKKSFKEEYINNIWKWMELIKKK